ncbi:hypothetical protein [Brenneria roseae]|nr:hypothetical protein [Brenneria roseae]
MTAAHRLLSAVAVQKAKPAAKDYELPDIWPSTFHQDYYFF